MGSRPAIGKTKEPQPIPVIDAEAGPCSAEMSVTDLSAKPVARATIRVHISHGFFGMRKTDLEIGTNAEGKAKFIGLPDDADEILYFHALKGRRVGMSGYSPSLDCHAKRFIVLHKPK